MNQSVYKRMKIKFIASSFNKQNDALYLRVYVE
jgi:hypothetical protein